MASQISTQAAIAVVSYSLLVSTVFLPTTSYDDLSMTKRLKASAQFLITGTVIAYTMNCMSSGGKCSAWPWILTLLLVVYPVAIGMWYYIDKSSYTKFVEKLKSLFEEDGSGSKTSSAPKEEPEAPPVQYQNPKYY